MLPPEWIDQINKRKNDIHSDNQSQPLPIHSDDHYNDSSHDTHSEADTDSHIIIIDL